MEIERKFLVAELPDLRDSKAVEIEQGYLALADGEGGARCACDASRRTYC